MENYPQGKMRKLYKGEHAGEYTHALAPTPDKITRMGMARTFQNIRLWKDQTVFDNVLTAMHCRATCNLPHRDLPSEPAGGGAAAPAGGRAAGGGEPQRRFRGEGELPCPTASSGGWRSPGPWPRIRSCCCWTNRLRA